MEVRGQCHVPFALPLERSRYPSYMRLGGNRDRSGRVWKISPPTGVRTPNRPALSESLYRLRCPGPRAHNNVDFLMVDMSKHCMLPWTVISVKNASKGVSVHVSSILQTVCWWGTLVIMGWWTILLRVSSC